MKKSNKGVNKRRDQQRDIHVQEAQKDKKEEMTTMMTEIIKEDLPKIKKIRKKTKGMKEETDEEQILISCHTFI